MASKNAFRAFFYLRALDGDCSPELANRAACNPALRQTGNMRRQMQRQIRRRFGNAGELIESARRLGYEFTPWRYFAPAGALVTFTGKRPQVCGYDFPQLARWLLGDDSPAEVYPYARTQFISDARELARGWAQDESSRLAIDARYGALCKFLRQEF